MANAITKGVNTYATKREKLDLKPILIYVIGAIAFPVIISMAYAFMASTRGIDTFEIAPEALTIMTVLGEALSALLFIIAYRRRLALDWKSLKERKKLGFSIICGIITILINVLLFNIIVKLGVETENQDALGSMLASSIIPSVLLMVVFAPICEEFLFRYCLGTIFRNKIVFCIVSSVLFALAHAQNAAAIVYLAIGLMFSLVYRNTNNNIVASIITHMINNLYGVAIMLLTMLAGL